MPHARIRHEAAGVTRQPTIDVMFRRARLWTVKMTQISMTESRPAETTAIAVLGAISFCHLLNDMMQSLLPALYPILKTSLGLGFGQVGLITLTYQMTASLLQPVVGLVADRRPRPY